MATRKIRLDLSGTVVDSEAAIVDIDFNGSNLDADVSINGDNIIKEYTVDVNAGTYNLDITFKNDIGGDTGDRNITINKVEIANDGSNYAGVFLKQENTSNFPTNLAFTTTESPGGILVSNSGRSNKDMGLNPDFDPSQPRTDDVTQGYIPGTNEGSNARWLYQDYYNPETIFDNRTVTVNVTFS